MSSNQFKGGDQYQGIPVEKTPGGNTASPAKKWPTVKSGQPKATGPRPGQVNQKSGYDTSFQGIPLNAAPGGRGKVANKAANFENKANETRVKPQPKNKDSWVKSESSSKPAEKITVAPSSTSSSAQHKTELKPTQQAQTNHYGGSFQGLQLGPQ